MSPPAAGQLQPVAVSRLRVRESGDQQGRARRPLEALAEKAAALIEEENRRLRAEKPLPRAAVFGRRGHDEPGARRVRRLEPPPRETFEEGGASGRSKPLGASLAPGLAGEENEKPLHYADLTTQEVAADRREALRLTLDASRLTPDCGR